MTIHSDLKRNGHCTICPWMIFACISRGKSTYQWPWMTTTMNCDGMIHDNPKRLPIFNIDGTEHYGSEITHLEHRRTSAWMTLDDYPPWTKTERYMMGLKLPTLNIDGPVHDDPGRLPILNKDGPVHDDPGWLPTLNKDGPVQDDPEFAQSRFTQSRFTQSRFTQF